MLKKDTIISLLRQSGLTLEEAQVFLSMLSLGPETIISISADSGLQRTLVYRVIKSLHSKDLVEVSTIGKKKYYSSVRPSQLSSYLQNAKEQIARQEDAFNNAYPTLQELFRSNKIQISTSTYDGFTGCETMFRELTSSFTNDGEKLKIIAGDNEDILVDYLEKHAVFYFSLRRKFKIFADVISTNNARLVTIGYRKIQEELDEERSVHTLNGYRGISFLYKGGYYHCDITDSRFIGVSIQDSLWAANFLLLFQILQKQG